jgi:transposase
MAGSSKFSPEVRERTVRMVLDQRDPYASQWEAIRSIAAKIGSSSEALRKLIERSAIDSDRKPGITTDERKRVAELEREVVELRRANEILRKASAPLRVRGLRAPAGAERALWIKRAPSCVRGDMSDSVPGSSLDRGWMLHSMVRPADCVRTQGGPSTSSRGRPTSRSLGGPTTRRSRSGQIGLAQAGAAQLGSEIALGSTG